MPPREHPAADPDATAESYLHLRRCALQVLRKWAAPMAEELADETIFRVFQAIQNGTNLDNAEAFTTAVAKNVYREYLRESKLQSHIAIDDSIASPLPHASEDPETDECMRFCLRKLSAEDRALMRKYYRSPGSDARMQIANELGVTLETLRVRIHRIRKSLQDCVSECRQQKPKANR